MASNSFIPLYSHCSHLLFFCPEIKLIKSTEMFSRRSLDVHDTSLLGFVRIHLNRNRILLTMNPMSVSYDNKTNDGWDNFQLQTQWFVIQRWPYDRMFYCFFSCQWTYKLRSNIFWQFVAWSKCVGPLGFIWDSGIGILINWDFGIALLILWDFGTSGILGLGSRHLILLGLGF